MRDLFVGVIGGFITCLAAGASAATFYVNAQGGNPAPPYADWSTAATNIQDAIDAAADGDLIVVTNGTYASGGRTMDGHSTNRVTLDKAATVESVNGPINTTIQGVYVGGNGGPTPAVRCAWLTNNAALIGFTLKGGGTASMSYGVNAASGGGVWCASSNALVANCIIASNVALQYGGGVYQGTVNNCLINSNNAMSGGGAFACNLKNCTIVSNANDGVAQQGTTGTIYSATNCIILSQSGNYVSGVYGYCCTTPLPPGAGNFTNPPQLFVDNAHLTTDSPCIGAGTNLAVGTDLFGQAWANPPSVGCAEWQPTPVTTTAQLNFAGLPAGFSVGSVAGGPGPVTVWWIKDGVALADDGHFAGTQTTNLSVAGLSLADAGMYQLAASNSFGMTLSTAASLVIHCVDPGGLNPVAPFATWDTAATNIQEAIDAAWVGELVLVTNGVYDSGGRSLDGTTTNRVTLDRAVTVTSVNGPWTTVIRGAGAMNGPLAVRCALLTNNAALVGFTLEWGATRTGGVPVTLQTGGGAWCASGSALVANCVIVSNVAASFGGGVYQGTLRNCYIYSNALGGSSGGGGAAYSTIYDCTLVSNLSGAIYSAAATNCIFYPLYGGSKSTYGFCCGVSPISGPGNFTNAPLFLPDGVHLQNGSPCIGAGTNVAAGTDIFGQPWANPPSVGCAEVSSVPAVTAPQLKLALLPPGFTVGNASVSGQGPLKVWWVKDGTALADNGHLSGAQTTNLTAVGVNFADAGNYQLVISNRFGMATSAVATLVAHCVDGAGTGPSAPYANWATAATNIQDAIDSSSAGDIVIVTNGDYASSGKSADGFITNRVTLDKAIIVQSANGAGPTIIEGEWDPATTNGPLSVRCAWLTNNAALSGFTLRHGATRGGNSPSGYGGGSWAVATNAVVADCIYTNNFAEDGGGAMGGTIINSFFSGNAAIMLGGGAYVATLNNCTLVQNYTAQLDQEYEHWGAGVSQCVTRNSIVVFNGDLYPLGAEEDDYSFGQGPNTVSFDHSCTFTNFSGPVISGARNVFIDPLLIDPMHIAAASPCRGAGSASYAMGTDLDGDAWANPPSMGCNEVIDAELAGPLTVSIQATGTNVNVSAPQNLQTLGFTGIVTGRASSLNWSFGDGQGVTNSGFIAGHGWTNLGIYVVTLTAVNADHPSGVSASVVVHVGYLPAPTFLPLLLTNGVVTLGFNAAAHVNYYVQYATNLTPPVAWQPLQTIIQSPGGPTRVSDAPPTNEARFYRILAQ